MRLSLFGATGGIGRFVLEQALAAGHDVTLLTRDPGKVADPAAGSASSSVTSNGTSPWQPSWEGATR